jgi:hypothetical protein
MSFCPSRGRGIGKNYRVLKIRFARMADPCFPLTVLGVDASQKLVFAMLTICVPAVSRRPGLSLMSE